MRRMLAVPELDLWGANSLMDEAVQVTELK
jgi:hypothetical protein